MRGIGLIVLTTAGLLVGLVLPAGAQQVPVTFSGPVVLGQTIILTCPDGEKVELDAGVPNASATFYKAANRKHLIGSDTPTSSTATSVSWLVPRARSTRTQRCTASQSPPPR